MRISHVTVCVDYLDYMEVALHHNRPEFDEFVVVTSHADRATQAFCAFHQITCVVTDAFYRGGAAFNKGAALNEGLAALRPGAEWVCIMDADTFVPPGLRSHVAALDKEWMYGARRVLLPTWADYEGLWTRDIESHQCPEGFAFGWFQLFHWDSAAIKACAPGTWYPEGRDCTEVDWRFFRRFGDLVPGYESAVGRIAKLPFRVFNLGPDGINHTGRKSAPFVSPS